MTHIAFGLSAAQAGYQGDLVDEAWRSFTRVFGGFGERVFFLAW